MCGIAGFIGAGEASRADLQAMCDAIVHRGPDDEGLFVEGGAALGMRRLSIIDVAHGHQPMESDDQRFVIVFNGEIYNFREIRAGLESQGHRFRTDSDTECILRLFIEKGAACVEDLRGMFAFAIWDRRESELFLARDRVGKKPLYYAPSNQSIVFGSELKSIIRAPGFERRVDHEALHHYLTYQYVPHPWSILEGVKKLEPGHTLMWRAGNDPTIRRYWDLRFTPKSHLDEAEAIRQLRSVLREATELRMIAERPLGAFLSGGVDSSLIVALMAELSTQPVKTFSIGFDEEAFDERTYARMVARRFGTDHHELVVRPDVIAMLPELSWYYDEPFADSSAIPSMCLAQMAREHVVVALNGDGADESFGGYERYRLFLAASRVPMPQRLRHLTQHAGARMAATEIDNRGWRRLGRLLTMIGKADHERYAQVMCHFDNERKQALYSSAFGSELSGIDSFGLLADEFLRCTAPELLDRILGVDVSTYLPGDLLVKMDRATMAHSLEARSPFLDHKVMEFAASLPVPQKLHGRTGKVLLKKMARGLLPDEILDRPKRGFGVPMAAWLRGGFRSMSRDLLTDTTATQRGYFEPRAVQRLLDEHDAGIDHSTRIWNLVQLELWHRTFFDVMTPVRAITENRRSGPLEVPRVDGLPG